MQTIVKQVLENTPGPLKVRSSTAKIIDNLKFIEIDYDQIQEIAKVVRNKLEKKEVLTEDQFGTEKPGLQLIFILDSINFCFWAHKDEEKWTVEYPLGKFISNGWYALVHSFERARKEGIPILDANYLERLTITEAQHIFRSSNSTQIPLLHERVEILNSLGKNLNKHFDGKIQNMLSETGYKAETILINLIKYLPTFEDYSIYNKQRVNFYKRAQIFVYDISFLPDVEIENLEALTAFADYKIPQILRAFKVLKYKSMLAGMKEV